MNKGFRLVVTIIGLLAVYYVLQLLFLHLATELLIKIASHTGAIPAEAVDFSQNIQYVNDHPAVKSCLVNARALGILFSTVSMLLFIHFAGYYRLRRGLWRSLSSRPLVISTLLVYSSMVALNIFVQWFPLQDNLDTVFDGLSHNILGAFGLAVLAPMLEEVLFRGAIQGCLMRFYGRPWPAIITAALVFGIIHWNPVQIVYASLFGIVLGWIYYRTGSLLYVIVGHVLNNTFAVITTVLGSGAEEKAVSGGSVGIASFVIFALLSVYLAVKLNNSLPPVEELKSKEDNRASS